MAGNPRPRLKSVLVFTLGIVCALGIVAIAVQRQLAAREERERVHAAFVAKQKANDDAAAAVRQKAVDLAALKASLTPWIAEMERASLTPRIALDRRIDALGDIRRQTAAVHYSTPCVEHANAALLQSMDADVFAIQRFFAGMDATAARSTAATLQAAFRDQVASCGG